MKKTPLAEPPSMPLQPPAASATDAAAVPALTRRHVFAGAGAAGVLAAVATVVSKPAPVAAVQAAAEPLAPTSGGYQLTEHVQRYYQTARV